MFSLQKSDKLRDVRYDIRGPISEEAEKMERQGVEIIKLNTGNPAAFGFEPPAFIPGVLEDMLQLTAAYSDSKGLYEAREAIADYCRGKNIPNVRPEDIYTGNGVSELIQISLLALLNNGDEILIPTPDYPLWTAAAIMSGGKVVHYLCDEQQGWYPDIQDIRRKITARTKAIVIINPNNPTGALYPVHLLEEIVKLAKENNLLLFADEIYDRLVMDGLEHVSVAALAQDSPVITFNGLSKSHQLCGFRCGWMVVSGDKSGILSYLEGVTVLASMRLCSNVPSQVLIKRALENPDRKSLLPGGRLYEQREYVYREINNIPGFSAVKPSAAMYLFPRMDTAMLGIHDDEKFVLDFLKEKHVLLTHGGSYNWSKPDHLRIVYLPRLEELEEVVRRLRDFVSTYRQ